MKPGDTLRKAAEIVEERGKTYDNDGYTAINATATLWTEYLGRLMLRRDSLYIDGNDVCVLMALHKIGRMMADRGHDDNYDDAIGYLALAKDV